MSDKDNNFDIEEAIRKLNLPPATINGQPNPDYYRAKMQRVNDMMLVALADGQKLPFNYESTIAGFEKEAKFAGLDAKSLMDRRSEGDKIADAVRQIMENPDESMFQMFDAQLHLIETTFERAATEMCQDVIRHCNGTDEIPEYHIDAAKKLEREKKIERLKKMASRARRVLRLRKLIRNPTPDLNAGLGVSGKDINGWEAANILGYMLYTHRTNTLDHGQVSPDGIQTRILQIGKHHAQFAVLFWAAYNGHVFHPLGVKKYAKRWDGLVFVVHPGAGKTELATAVLERLICANPMIQSVYLHAVERMAQDAVAYIQNAFTMDNDVGLRRAALFPGIELEEKNRSRMRVALRNRMKSPTVTASGVTAKSLGANTDFQIFDDVVPQSDRDQEAERTRRKAMLGGQWESRQRGKAFRLVIGTLWHNDDYLAWLLDQAERGKINYMWAKLPAGGPDDNPPWRSIWPEVYPPEKLKQIYAKMPDRTVYDCAYRIDTKTQESRIIKSIRYYDPFDREHEEFMANAITYVSADPSGTAKVESDRAGLLHLALGEHRYEAGPDGYKYEVQLRILEAKSMSINQPDLVRAIIDFGMVRKVDEVHIETIGGFHATADFLEEQVEGLRVVRHQTGNRDKGTRLRMCASLIDNSMPGLPAKVLFPGERKADGTIGPCDDNQRLYDQILMFDASSRKNKEFVDSLTQIVNHFLKNGILAAGEGEASTLFRRATEYKGDQRIRAWLNDIQKNQNDHGPAGDEETKWMMRRWGFDGYSP